MSKEALITGITGQDGSYLAELLLKEGYKVTGTVRKKTDEGLPNIAHIQNDIRLIRADLTDYASLVAALEATRPDEVYNLASQSAPGESWKIPFYTADINAMGALRVFEAVRQTSPECRVFQASSSEMFGWVLKVPQDEQTPFNPANPYAAAKLFAHTQAKIYRSSYNMFIACGILFNHESPRRGLGFVTQKVAYSAACAKLGIKNSPHLNELGEPIVQDAKVNLGNLDAERDWGFAGDYVKAMRLILQQEEPDDFVIATGETHTIRELCEVAYRCVGLNWEDYVQINQRLIRPTETGPLIGNPEKIMKELGFKPEVRFPELIPTMVKANLTRLNNYLPLG